MIYLDYWILGAPSHFEAEVNVSLSLHKHQRYLLGSYDIPSDVAQRVGTWKCLGFCFSVSNFRTLLPSLCTFFWRFIVWAQRHGSSSNLSQMQRSWSRGVTTVIPRHWRPRRASKQTEPESRLSDTWQQSAPVWPHRPGWNAPCPAQGTAV